MSPKYYSHHTMQRNLNDCGLPRKHFDDEKNSGVTATHRLMPCRSGRAVAAP